MNHVFFDTALIAVALLCILSSFALRTPAGAQPAEDPSVAAAPAMPPAGTLRPGKISRDATGNIVLEQPAGAVERTGPGRPDVALPGGTPVTVSRPDAAAAPQGDAGDAPTGTRAPGETAGPEDRSVGGDSAGLPPPARLKSGAVRRSDAGDLTLAPRGRQELRVCRPQSPAPDCDFLSLADAIAAARPGDTIVLSKGVYEEAALVTVGGLTIKAEAGAHLRRRAVEGKAALVIRADNVVIEGLECSEISVPDGNGACVRIEGSNLTLRGVYFHDNQEGVLGGFGGTVLVEDSVFERNGARQGYSHGLYILGAVKEFTFRRSKVLSTKDEGQGVKSRAQKTIIEDSVIAGLASRDSRAIDIPNGGDIVIRGNVLQKGSNSSNSQMIGLGLEGNLHPESRAVVENNLIIFDDRLPGWVKIVNDTVPIVSPSGTVVYSRMPNVTLKDNAVVGVPNMFAGDGVAETGTRRYPTRSRANLPDYPALPAPGVRFNGRPD